MSGKSTLKKNITRPPERANSYFRFIFSKGQLLDWGLVTLSVIIGCLLVTRTYPYPGTTSDSFSYVFSAQTAMFTHFRPYGYSFFLRLVHLFSDSIYSVIVSQALIYIVSLGLLLLAVKKYWPARKEWTFKVFEAVVALSPAAIFMLDTILSDTLQCALVFVMVSMLIVMIKDESWVAMVIYLAALFVVILTDYMCDRALVCINSNHYRVCLTISIVRRLIPSVVNDCANPVCPGIHIKLLDLQERKCFHSDLPHIRSDMNLIDHFFSMIAKLRRLLTKSQRSDHLQ